LVNLLHLSDISSQDPWVTRFQNKFAKTELGIGKRILSVAAPTF